MTNILISRSNNLNEEWSRPHLKNIFKEGMKVVVLGFSFFGNLSEEKYNEYYGPTSDYKYKIDESFSEYGITNIKWIYYFNMSKEEMINLVNSADILYLPGGAPDLMYERILEKDILQPLKEFNKIIVGSSAGAMIQLESYHISPDYDYNKFSEHKGLGYIDSFFIEVHYNRRKRQKSSLRKMRRLYKKPIYTIPDDGMVIVQEGNIIALNSARLHSDKKGIIK